MNSLVPLKRRRSRRIYELRNPKSCFDVLDDNLLIEILIRLPAKCANRYKCVSKTWNSLISHPYFARRFIHHLSTKSMSSLPSTIIFSWGTNIKRELFITPDDSEVYKPPRLYSTINQFEEVVASYNDLTLCRRVGNNSGVPNVADVFYICNPLTNQKVKLPPAPTPRHKHEACVCYGFYCDNNNHSDNTRESEYVVVRIPLYKYSVPVLIHMKYKLEIFSSRTNQWSESYVACQHYGKPRYFITGTNGIFYNKILYMLCYTNIFRYEPFRIHDNNGDGDDDDGSYTIDFPSDFMPRNYYRNNILGLCQGRLRLSQYLMNEVMLCVWELKEEDQNKDSNWCLRHKVFLNQMASENSKLVRLFKTPPNVYSIVFHPCDADIVYLSLCNCTVVCNLRCMTIEHASFFSPGQCLPSTSKVPLVLRWPTPVPTLM